MQVLYGLDFPAETRAQQLAAVRDAVLAHVNTTHDPLLVSRSYVCVHHVRKRLFYGL
jgi:hypothetical protein